MEWCGQEMELKITPNLYVVFTQKFPLSLSSRVCLYYVCRFCLCLRSIREKKAQKKNPLHVSTICYIAPYVISLCVRTCVCVYLSFMYRKQFQVSDPSASFVSKHSPSPSLSLSMQTRINIIHQTYRHFE